MNDVTDDINTNLRPSLLYDSVDGMTFHLSKAIICDVLVDTLYVIK